MRANLIDQVPLETREVTDEGFLLAQAAVTRANTVSQYTRGELGLDGDPGETVGVLRTEDTVFHDDTLSTLRLRPVTQGHPSDGVDPENARLTMVGSTGENPTRDEDALVIAVAIHDQDTITDVEAGKDQVSLGYQWLLREESGELDGVSYDYVSDSPMKINHLAVVSAGRLGPEVRIRDEDPSLSTAPEPEEDPVSATDTGTTEPPQVVDTSVMVDLTLSLFDYFYIDGEEEMSEDIITRITEMIQNALSGDGSVNDSAVEIARVVAGDMDRVVNDRAVARADLLLKARDLMSEDKFNEVKGKDEKTILVAAVGDSVEDAENRPIAYLQAALDFLPRSGDDTPPGTGRARAEAQRRSAATDSRPVQADGEENLGQAYDEYDEWLKVAHLNPGQTFDQWNAARQN